jgi:hypothetical protein
MLTGDITLTDLDFMSVKVLETDLEPTEQYKQS